MTNNSKKSGIITIIGEVNAGKSSLLNILVKKNISIIIIRSKEENSSNNRNKDQTSKYNKL